MRKLFFLFLITFVSLIAAAQSKENYDLFKVEISLGYAMPSGSGAKGGALFVVEPKYAITSNLLLGLRLETAIMARGVESSNGFNNNNLEIKGSGSYLVTGDYFLSDNRSFKPFVGTGFGIYRLAAATTATAGADVSDASTKLGSMFRTGFETGLFRLGIEYNWIPDTEFTSTNGASTKFTYKNSYIGIKLGVCFGGKKKKV